jgi:hypothetical protein
MGNNEKSLRREWASYPLAEPGPNVRSMANTFTSGAKYIIGVRSQRQVIVCTSQCNEEKCNELEERALSTPESNYTAFWKVKLAPASLHCANLNLVAFQAHNKNGGLDEIMMLIFMRRFRCKL